MAVDRDSKEYLWEVAQGCKKMPDDHEGMVSHKDVFEDDPWDDEDQEWYDADILDEDLPVKAEAPLMNVPDFIGSLVIDE